MSAILKSFTIKLTERQAGQILRQFSKACKDAGVGVAAMIAQPRTQWGGFGSVGLKPPVLQCAVISTELFDTISKTIKEHRP